MFRLLLRMRRRVRFLGGWTTGQLQKPGVSRQVTSPCCQAVFTTLFRAVSLPYTDTPLYLNASRRAFAAGTEVTKGLKLLAVLCTQRRLQGA